MRSRLPAAATATLALLTACASTPQASPELDREAKRFAPHPDSSTIYVYRTDTPGLQDDSVLWINGRLIGATLPRTFFQVHLNPGMQRLAGYGVDNGTLELDTRPGEAYFVQLRVLAGHSRFEAVDPDLARGELPVCCALLENWRPGQRPLLR